MEKIINKIKSVLFKILPKDRQLEGDSYQRGRQSLAIEIADIIDPISSDVQPNINVEDGEVLFNERIIAKPTTSFGCMHYVLGLSNEDVTVSLANIPWDDEEHRNTEYEVIIRKIGKANPEKAKEELRPKRRRERNDNIKAAMDFQAFMPAHNFVVI